jgi:hypothetical protein
MKKNGLIVLVMSCFILTACAGSPVTTPANIPSQIPPTQVQTAKNSPAPTQGQITNSSEVSFSRDIMPIFQKYSDSHHSAGNFYSLDTYEGVTQDVVPGNPEQSKLYRRLTGQGGPQMPPGSPLPDNLIKLIYDWIKQGAKNN